MDDKKIKKSLMFATGDDLYFIIYNIVILLKRLKCNGEPTKFVDYKKLAFLISFISDRNLINIIDSDRLVRNKTDQLLLSKAYSDGLMRINQVKRVLFILEKNKIIAIEYGPVDKIWLLEENIGDMFFDTEHFKYELLNSTILKGVFHSLTKIRVETLLDRLFSNNGIETWVTF